MYKTFYRLYNHQGDQDEMDNSVFSNIYHMVVKHVRVGAHIHAMCAINSFVTRMRCCFINDSQSYQN